MICPKVSNRNETIPRLPNFKIILHTLHRIKWGENPILGTWQHWTNDLHRQRSEKESTKETRDKTEGKTIKRGAKESLIGGYGISR